MTDITRLINDLNLRMHSAKNLGFDFLFLKLDDLDVIADTLEKAKRRIEELEESNAQVIQSRDHYKRMTEEGLKQLAESRTVTVKLPEAFYPDGDIECPLVVELEDVKEMLTAAGIKVEENNG